MSNQADPQSTATDRQVLVVGDGVGGLTTAALLDQGGLSPVVVTPHERDHEPTRLLVLYSSALALLSDLGVTDTLRTSATPVRQWAVQGFDGSRVERFTSAHGERWPFVTVGPTHLRRVLCEQLPAGSIRLSKTPCGLEPTDAGVSVEFTDGVRERFDVVVGADGTRSWVRAGRFDSDPPTSWGTTSWLLRAEGRPGTPETVTEQWCEDGTLTCGPCPGRGRLRFVTTSVDEYEPEAALRQLWDSFDLGTLSPRRAGLNEPSGLTVIGGHVDNAVRTDRWVTARTALVGAAARPLPPVLSVGPSLAVEDAYVLAAELVAADSPTAALDRYARRRQDRHRLLDQHVPFADRFPGACGAETMCGWHPLRVALLRSFFADRVPAVSDAVGRYL